MENEFHSLLILVQNWTDVNAQISGRISIPRGGRRKQKKEQNINTACAPPSLETEQEKVPYVQIQCQEIHGPNLNAAACFLWQTGWRSCSVKTLAHNMKPFGSHTCCQFAAIKTEALLNKLHRVRFDHKGAASFADSWCATTQTDSSWFQLKPKSVLPAIKQFRFKLLVLKKKTTQAVELAAEGWKKRKNPSTSNKDNMMVMTEFYPCGNNFRWVWMTLLDGRFNGQLMLSRLAH